jgi:hypothetical protein
MSRAAQVIRAAADKDVWRHFACDHLPACTASPQEFFVNGTRFIAAVAAFACLFSIGTAGALPFAVSGSFGSLGAGIDGSVKIKPWLNGRVSTHLFNYSSDVNIGGIDYNGDFKLFNSGLFADFFPLLGNKVRLSLGMLYNSNKIGLHEDCQEGCNVNGMIVSGAGTQLNGAVDFRRFAPYAGLGWGNVMSGSRFQMMFDAGVMFQGTPKVNLEASGIATITETGGVFHGMDLQSSPLALDTLEYEQTQIAESISKYRYYPVVSFSAGWRF